MLWTQRPVRDFPGGPVVKYPPPNTGHTGLGPGLGRSHICIVDGNVNWSSHCGKCVEVPQKTELPYDPAILLLGIDPK